MNLLRKTRERLNERGMELLWDFEERQGIMTNEKKKNRKKDSIDWETRKKYSVREAQI